MEVSKAERDKALRRLHEDLGNGTPSRANPVDDYLRGKSSTTVVMARSVLRNVAALIERDPDEVPWHRLTAASYGAVFTLLPRSLSASGINNYHSVLRGIAKEAAANDQLSSTDLSRILKFPRRRVSKEGSGRAVKPQQIQDLIRVCRETEGPAGIRDIALLSLLFTAGPRRTELVNIDVKDIDHRALSITILGKGDKPGRLRITAAVDRLIRDWLAVSGIVSGPVFVRVARGGSVIQGSRLTPQGVYDIIARRATQAGWVNEKGIRLPLSPHDFRRGFITYLRDCGEDIETVREMARHASADTTRRYIRDQEDRYREAAEKFDLKL